MKLFFRKTGSGKPLVILHGLFGLSDNWNTLGKQFAERFEVFLADLRNHGESPHSDEMNYKMMSGDVLELFDENKIDRGMLLGHSLGGKVAMQFALDHPERIEKLIVVDMAPKHYPVSKDVLDAIQSLDLQTISSRKQAEEFLSNKIKDNSTRLLLLKNLYWKGDKLEWKFYKKGIIANIENISGSFATGNRSCPSPALFIRGERSDYISDEDFPYIRNLFPRAEFITIPSAGHWVHAERPEEFYQAVMIFLESSAG